MEKMKQIQMVTNSLMIILNQAHLSRGKKELSKNYIQCFVAGKAISMSALPAPVIGNHGPVYSIPTVQCRLNPDASDSFTTKRLDTTTVNGKGRFFVFIKYRSLLHFA